MKKIIIFLTVAIFTVMGCQNETKVVSTKKSFEEEVKSQIMLQVDSLYAVYERFDYDWIEFFANNYTAIYANAPIQHMTKDSLRAQWKRIYAKYDVKLLDRGRPNIIASQDMAISYNTFHEIFINKDTHDTIKNVGVYIVNWKRQPNDSWKIVFETVQTN